MVMVGALFFVCMPNAGETRHDGVEEKTTVQFQLAIHFLRMFNVVEM